MINTKLIFYWYVHKTGWNKVYNIHLKMLNAYSNRFDEKEFIIATDPDTPQENIDAVKNAIIEIIPDAIFTSYPNDKNLRESNYFYNEIAKKLDQMEDKWYFFAHNKGVDSWYAPGELCGFWITGMYFMNLHYIDKIKEQMDSTQACVIGTYLIRNLKAWVWLKYNWHFSGTFWWFNPKRITDALKELHTSIPYKNDRYFTESVWGTCFPDTEKYRLPALGMYNANWRQSVNWMTKEMKDDLLKVIDE
jgi:hypothetical protein